MQRVPSSLAALAKLALAAILIAALLGAVCQADEKSEGPRVIVKKIVKIELQIQESAPPNLVVVVTGEVPTGGWKNAVLVRAVYEKPPADGMHDYFLLAEKPTGIVTQVVSQITAKNTMKAYTEQAPWLKGVRIHGVDGGVKEEKLP